jgi:L-amino acid N-acyltransferase YncA
MFAYFIDGNIHETQAKDQVIIGYYFEEGDTVPIIYNYQETTELKMFLKDRKLQSVWTPKTSGTMYPLNQIPANKKQLDGFAWYDEVRPRNRYDIFVWRSKKNDRSNTTASR